MSCKSPEPNMEEILKRPSPARERRFSDTGLSTLLTLLSSLKREIETLYKCLTKQHKNKCYGQDQV